MVNWHKLTWRGDLEVLDIAKYFADVLSRPIWMNAVKTFKSNFWVELRKSGLGLQKKKQKQSQMKLPKTTYETRRWFISITWVQIFQTPCLRRPGTHSLWSWTITVISFLFLPLWTGHLNRLLLCIPYKLLLNQPFTITESFLKHFEVI